jgi:uncharacterized protein VirK/YbjX
MGEIQSRPLQLSVSAPIKVGSQSSHITSDEGMVALRELGKLLELLRRRLFILARQRRDWSPFMILGELWRLLTNLGMHREILELLKLRPFDEIAQNNPRLAFKYVIPNYLARDFTLTERVACFLHHYRRMHAALPENVLRQILQGDVRLHETSNGINCFALTLGLPEPYLDQEGELSLNMQVDGKKVFNLSFTIVPGWVLRSQAKEILFITRLQGAPGCNTQIRLACKAFHDYPPRCLLLAVLQGIGDAFGIGEIGAVCATNQKSFEKGSPNLFKAGYDDFFAKVGMVKTAAGFYSSPIPIKEKPLASFKGSARPRARKRRIMVQQIQSACAGFLLGVVDRAAESFSGAARLALVPEAVESQPSPVSCPTTGYNPTP